MEVGRFLLIGAGETSSTGEEGSWEFEGQDPSLLQGLPTCPHPNTQPPGPPT